MFYSFFLNQTLIILQRLRK